MRASGQVVANLAVELSFSLPNFAGIGHNRHRVHKSRFLRSLMFIFFLLLQLLNQPLRLAVAHLHPSGLLQSPQLLHPPERSNRLFQRQRVLLRIDVLFLFQKSSENKLDWTALFGDVVDGQFACVSHLEMQRVGYSIGSLYMLRVTLARILTP